MVATGRGAPISGSICGAVGEDAALHRAQLLLDPIDPPLDRLARLRKRRARERRGQRRAMNRLTHLVPRLRAAVGHDIEGA